MLARQFRFAAVAALAAFALSLAAGRPAVGADAKSDKDLIQGKWVAKSISENGKELQEEALKDGKMTLTFAGDQVTANHGGEADKPAGYTLDPAKTPKEIKISPSEGPEKGKTYNGVYELAGDALTIAFSPEANEPTPPDLKPAAKRIVLKLERAK